MPTQSDKPKRRWLRLSLRTLLVLLTVGCVLFAWLGWCVRRVNQQRQAEAAQWVKRWGGSVQYELGSEPSRSNWFANLIGINYVDVVSVTIRESLVDDVTPLANLKSLKSLYLDSTSISDVEPLANLKKLKRLHLGGTRVRDVSHLSNLSRLEVLHLSYTQISDVKPLAKLENLELLQLNSTQISDVTPLTNLKRLRRLGLDDTRVSQEDVERLQKSLPSLEITGP